MGELCRSLKRRAKRQLGLASVAQAHTGAVCAVQRTDGALRLNVHLHVLSLDGVYVRDSESAALVFESSARPATPRCSTWPADPSATAPPPAPGDQLELALESRDVPPRGVTSAIVSPRFANAAESSR